MGVGVDPTLKLHYVWFSTQTDPNGSAPRCETPRLDFTAITPNQIRISWQPNLPGWVLQESPSLSPEDWVNSPANVTNGATVSIDGKRRFYRLARP